MGSKRLKRYFSHLDRLLYGHYSTSFSRAWRFSYYEDFKHLTKLQNAKLVQINSKAIALINGEAERSKAEGKERIMVLRGYFDASKMIIHITDLIPYDEIEGKGKVLSRGRTHVDGSIWWEVALFRERHDLSQEGPIMICHTHLSDLPLKEGIGKDIIVAGITRLPEMVVKANNTLEVLVYSSKREFLSQGTTIIPHEIEQQP